MKITFFLNNKNKDKGKTDGVRTQWWYHRNIFEDIMGAAATRLRRMDPWAT
jgi:hypothetical protein